MRPRLATQADCEVMARLHRICLPQTWRAQDFAAWLDRGEYRLLLMEEAGHLAGYVVARALPPEAEVVTLAVAPEYRRRGVAHALMTALMEDAAVTTWFLEVSMQNVPARALYAALGFEETGRRARYYADGTDAVLLSLSPGEAIKAEPRKP